MGTCAPKHVHQKKFCVNLMIHHWDAKAHTHAKPDQRTTWMNIVQVLPIAQFTAKQMNSTAHLEKTKMAANYPTNVPKVNCSVLEVLMKQDAKDQAVAEIKKNTDGDLELKKNPKQNVLDIVQLNVSPMKSYVHPN